MIDYPLELSPLAKPSGKDPTKAAVFQPFIGGLELARAYSELNDSKLQEKNFIDQEREREVGNQEAMPTDKDFVNALEHGMPPACGVGIGIERIVMLFANQTTVRDVIMFPFMKPIKEEKQEVIPSKLQFPKFVLPINREQALDLVKKYNSDTGDLNHYLESEAVMRELAKHLKQDEEAWGMLGLLHDIDWGITKQNTQTHLTKAPQILKDAGFDDVFVETVVSHGCGFDCAGLKDKKRTKKIEHALAASETVTGLVHAYALMRKSIEGMEVKGLKKKFDDKRFAAAIDRDIIRESEHLGISLDQFFEISIRAIQKIADQVNLKHIK